MCACLPLYVGVHVKVLSECQQKSNHKTTFKVFVCDGLFCPALVYRPQASHSPSLYLSLSLCFSFRVTTGVALVLFVVVVGATVVVVLFLLPSPPPRL